MTHYTITVALPGEIESQTELETALAEAMHPFDENTPVAPYVRYTAEQIAADTQYQLHKAQHPGLTPVDWYGGANVGGNIVSTYNQDSQWDWYVIGGRWGGYWELKPEMALQAARDLTQPSSFGYSDQAEEPNRTDVARVQAICPESMKPTFAVIGLDGTWSERGRIGWFGTSRDEKEEPVWEAEYLTWVASLPADTWLVLVDAHI